MSTTGIVYLLTFRRLKLPTHITVQASFTWFVIIQASETMKMLLKYNSNTKHMLFI